MSARQRVNLRRLEHKAGVLNRLLGSGAFQRLPAPVRRGWLRTVRRLYRSLVGVVPQATLRQILASGAALVIGLSACSDDSGTRTDTGARDTSTIEWRIDAGADQALADQGADTTGADAGVDAPSDAAPSDAAPSDAAPSDAAPSDAAPSGDQQLTDATLTDASTGGNSFKAAVASPFGFTKTTSYYNDYHPALADLDGDGDLDLLIGSYGYPGYSPGLYYYQNQGTASAPQLAAPVSNVFGVSPGTYYETTVAAVDIDKDGDLDLFVFGGYYQQVFFYKNTGTATAPVFGAAASSSYGITITSGTYAAAAPAFVDIDGDGDLDLFLGEAAASASASTLKFLENTGTASSPSFAAAQSGTFGLPANLSEAFAFADLDGDGDLDLIASPAGQTGFSYYQNTGTATAPQFAAPVPNPFKLVASGMTEVTAMVFGDVDGDGDLDLIQGYSDGILFFENTKK